MARRSKTWIEDGKVLARSLVHRLNGLSLPIIGASWVPPPDEREIIRRFLTFLEDRRVLFVPTYMEVPGEVTFSIQRIREAATATLQELSDKSEAAGSLRALRAACRRFLEEPRPDFRNLSPRRLDHWDDRDGFGPGFFTALGEFRATVGVHIAMLAHRFDLDVEGDLAAVLPPPGED